MVYAGVELGIRLSFGQCDGCCSSKCEVYAPVSLGRGKSLAQCRLDIVARGFNVNGFRMA